MRRRKNVVGIIKSSKIVKIDENEEISQCMRTMTIGFDRTNTIVVR